jgi:MraZ protein
MFLGKFSHTLDEKGRITLPARWREDLTEELVVTRGLDGCLFVLPKTKFQEIADAIDGLDFGKLDARKYQRLFSGQSADADLDKQGRILISPDLRQFAGLDGEAILVGVYSRIEIWNPKRFEEINSTVEAEAQSVAERIGDLMIERTSAKNP